MLGFVELSWFLSTFLTSSSFVNIVTITFCFCTFPNKSLYSHFSLIISLLCKWLCIRGYVVGYHHFQYNNHKAGVYFCTGFWSLLCNQHILTGEQICWLQVRFFKTYFQVLKKRTCHVILRFKFCKLNIFDFRMIIRMTMLQFLFSVLCCFCDFFCF